MRHGLDGTGSERGTVAELASSSTARVAASTPGYVWESAPIDSGCTLLLKQSSAGFSEVGPSTRSVRVASKDTPPIRCDGEGTFHFNVLDDKGKFHSLAASNAVYSSKLRNLLSSGIFEKQRHRVVLEEEHSHILLNPNPGERITDEILEEFAVVAEPHRVASTIAERFGGTVDRLACTFPFATDEERLGYFEELRAT